MLLFELKILRAFYRAAWQGVTCKKLFYSTARNLVADIASIALTIFSVLHPQREERATVFAAVPSDCRQHADVKGLMSLRFDFPL